MIQTLGPKHRSRKREFPVRVRRAFDEDVRSLLDRRRDIFGQSRTENADAVPLGFRGPLILRVLPGALRGD